MEEVLLKAHFSICKIFCRVKFAPFLNDEFAEQVASIMYFALLSSHVWVRIAQVRIVRMLKLVNLSRDWRCNQPFTWLTYASTYHVIDVCTAARTNAVRERRKNNKIINNNNNHRNKMMKTLPKSKDSPTVVGFHTRWLLFCHRASVSPGLNYHVAIVATRDV